MGMKRGRARSDGMRVRGGGEGGWGVLEETTEGRDVGEAG